MNNDVSHLIPNFKQPRPQLIIGGQPEANAWKQLADAGFRTVVNLRPDSEMPDRNEANEVQDAKLIYVKLPVEGNTDDAIAFGKQAGLTGMEPVVRELLSEERR